MCWQMRGRRRNVGARELGTEMLASSARDDGRAERASIVERDSPSETALPARRLLAPWCSRDRGADPVAWPKYLLKRKEGGSPGPAQLQILSTEDFVDRCVDRCEGIEGTLERGIRYLRSLQVMTEGQSELVACSSWSKSSSRAIARCLHGHKRRRVRSPAANVLSCLLWSYIWFLYLIRQRLLRMS